MKLMTALMVAGIALGGSAAGQQDKPTDQVRLPVLKIKKQAPKEGIIVIDVVDRAHAKAVGLKLEDDQPPIVVEGHQVKTFEQLRQWLRVRANPLRYPEKSLQIGTTLDGRKLYPSRRSLLIRCDREQSFGWCQALMQYCTFVHGNPQRNEIEQSPLIYKISFGVSGGRRILSHLPTDKKLSAANEIPFPEAEIILKIPKRSWMKPHHRREVIFMRKGSNTPFGRSLGYVSADDPNQPVTFRLDPPDTAKKIGAYLAGIRGKSENSRAMINAYPRTPHVYVMRVLEMMQNHGFKDVSYSGIPRHLIRDLVAGLIK